MDYRQFSMTERTNAREFEALRIINAKFASDFKILVDCVNDTTLMQHQLLTIWKDRWQHQTTLHVPNRHLKP